MKVKQLSMFSYDQFQDACGWEKKNPQKSLYHCYQYLFFLQ